MGERLTKSDVESVHLSDSLMKLSYNISQRESGRKK